MGAMYINRDGYLVWPADYHNARCLVKVSDCGECGEYRGEMFCPNTGETRPITCLCDGALCPHCGKTKLHKGGTDIVTRSWHIYFLPPFYARLGCGDCVPAVLSRLLEAAQGAYRIHATTQGAAYWQSRLASDEGGRNWIRYAENIRRYRHQSGSDNSSAPCVMGWSCHSCAVGDCRVQKAIAALSR